MKLFININRYNLIYGVLSNTIVLLMEMFFFFVIFLFFGQWLYTAQFFDSLLTCELYLLPSRENEKIFASLKRMLFIRPDFFLRHDSNVITMEKGNFIYKVDDTGRDVYYVFKGTVHIQHQNHIITRERGKLFGVESCMLDENRTENALAATDVEIIRIPQEVFKTLVERNPKASRKALSQLSTYFARYSDNKIT